MIVEDDATAAAQGDATAAGAEIRGDGSCAVGDGDSDAAAAGAERRGDGSGTVGDGDDEPWGAAGSPWGQASGVPGGTAGSKLAELGSLKFTALV